MVIPKREESYNGIYYFYLHFLFLSIKANQFEDIPIPPRITFLPRSCARLVKIFTTNATEKNEGLIEVFAFHDFPT